jgi:hypothetical protein
MKHRHGDLSLQVFEKKPHVFIASNSLHYVACMFLAPTAVGQEKVKWQKIGGMAQNLGSGTGYP